MRIGDNECLFKEQFGFNPIMQLWYGKTEGARESKEKKKAAKAGERDREQCARVESNSAGLEGYMNVLMNSCGTCTPVMLHVSVHF